MKIYPTIKTLFNTELYSKKISSIKKSVNEFFAPENVLTPKNCDMFNVIKDIAEKKYNRITAEPVKLSVKNGSREFTYTSNGSVWHRFSLTKKDNEIYDFELLHVKGDNSYQFYSTGAYQCKITDERFIKKYNDLLEDWLPRLVKRQEKLESRNSLNP